MSESEAPGMAGLRIEPDGEGSRLHLRVRPGGRRDRIAGPFGERLKVEVSAPPERGKANEAVRRLLAEVLGIGRERVTLTAGLTSPDKVVRLAGLDTEEVRRRLSGTG